MNGLAADEDLERKRRVKIGGEIREIGYQLRLRVEWLVAQPDGSPGLRRATHVAALIEVMYKAYHRELASGFFYSQLRRKIAKRLKTARLQPHESRFRHILDWDVDREGVRKEMASNLCRLLDSELTPCIRKGLELHVLFDLHMVGHFGSEYVSPIERDHWEYSALDEVRTEFKNIGFAYK